MKNSSILNLTKISIMAVIITLCSWMVIPFPVPFTLQTFGVCCALLLLGGKAGLFSLLLYMLSGVAGLPVFSAFSAGAGHLFSPTGGYIWGFVLCALFYIITEKFSSKTDTSKFLILFTGTLLCYTAGTVQFIFSSGNIHSLWQILSLCVLPFVIPDIIKIVFAILICKKIKPHINKNIKE